MKLTQTEWLRVYDNALKKFAKASKREMLAEIFGLRNEVRAGDADRLWLYIYALNNWDNEVEDNNYMTETQMLKILSKVNQNG